MSSGFVALVRQQPWYNQVEMAMASDHVPEYLWIGTIAAENPSAVGNQQVMNTPVPDSPGFSYGIFQFHNDPNAVDPVYSGNKAASIMGAALTPLGTNYTPRQALSAIEQAAWPGNDPALIAKEDPQRAAVLNNVISQETSTPLLSANGAQNDPNPNDNALQQWLYNNTPIGSAESGTNSAIANAQSGITNTVNSAVSGIQSTITGVAQQAFIGGIILAVIAGGFALLASSGGGSNVQQS